MKLRKSRHRSPLEQDPFSRELAHYSSPRRNLLKLAALYLACAATGGLLFSLPLLAPLADLLRVSFGRFLHLGPWEKFWLLAPALLLDSTRYYLTNALVFALHCIRAPFAKAEAHPYESAATCPMVSVIVPVFNEGKTIRHTLDSLLENNYPRFEVIVVDDCSADRTALVCRQYEKEGKITYVRKRERAGKPNSLNYGRQLAKGEIIVHVDGDCIFHRDSILEAVKPFTDKKVGAVAANLRVMNDGENLLTGFQAAEYGQCINVQRRWLSMTDTLQIASGAFSCFRKELLVDLQGVDTETGEDLDITLKVRKMGYKVVFAPKAIALTEVPNSLKALSKQRILWDRCYIRISLRKHRNVANLKEFRFGDFLAYMTDLLFNLGILFLFPFYIAWVCLYHPQLLPFILAITYLFYASVSLTQLLIAVAMSDSPARDSIFILYAPFYFFYSMYLRTVRTFAYILEIFRMKYFKQGAYPGKVWHCMPEHW